jgi:hypothetical protein
MRSKKELWEIVLERYLQEIDRVPCLYPGICVIITQLSSNRIILTKESYCLKNVVIKAIEKQGYGYDKDNNQTKEKYMNKWLFPITDTESRIKWLQKRIK